MPRLSLEEVKALASSVITTAKLSSATFNETRDNVVGLLDKIGKIHTLDTDYQRDKLNMFDGEYLSFGKTIESWEQDLIMPTSFDRDGAGALSPSDPTYRPVFYSYTIGRKKIKTTIRNDEIERAVHFEAQMAEIVALQFKRIEDSMAVYRYQLKREMIAKAYAIATSNDLGLSAAGTSYSSWALGTYPESTAYATAVGVKADSGLYVIQVSGGTGAKAHFNGAYIAVKNISATESKDLKDLIEEGYLIKEELVSEIAKPVDTSTGEAFIKQVKEDLEVASDVNEGHSLNGSCLGATDSLVLIVKQGVIPSVEVDTYAGAFHKEDVALPADLVVVKDFGGAPDSVYAVLMDRRGMRLHNTYNATRENVNGDGDFLNVFRHTEDTAFLSRSTFIKFYVAPGA